MGAIEKALAEIGFQIPQQILQKVFTPVYNAHGNRGLYLNQSSIDAQIRQLVIDARCTVDSNLIGADEVHIPLEGLPFEHIDRYAGVMHIPKERTNDRDIIVPLALIYGNSTYSGATTPASVPHSSSLTTRNSIAQGAKRAMEAMAPMPEVQNAWCSLIGPNTIAIEGYVPQISRGWLRALVSFDSGLSTLPPAYWNSFAKLCVLATKSYIYNFYRIDLDQGELASGRELGTFREIIDRYEISEEEYQEYRSTTWSAHLRLASPTKKNRYVKWLTGGMG